MSTPNLLLRRLLPRRLARSIAAAGVFVSALPHVGCADDPPLGSLIVPFVIGASRPCDEVGVARVTLTITTILGEDGDGAVNTYDKTVDCSEGEVRIDNVTKGLYSVLLEGKADDGVVTFDNIESDVLEAEVLEGQTVTTPEARLSSAPAQVHVRWALNKDGFQAMCADVQTKSFRITVFDESDNDVVASGTVPCDAAADAGMGYRRLPDEDRDIEGDDIGAVEIQPLDAANASVGEALTVEVETQPGPGRAVKIDLTCNDDVCEAALKAP